MGRLNSNKWMVRYLSFLATQIFIAITFGLGNLFWDSEVMRVSLNLFNGFSNLVYAVGTYLLYKKIYLPSHNKLKESYSNLLKAHEELRKKGIVMEPPSDYAGKNKFRFMYYSIILMNLALFFVNFRQVIV